MASRTLDEHIEATPDIAGGKPRVRGHRITVQDVAIWHERLGKSPDEIASEYVSSMRADGDRYAAAAVVLADRAGLPDVIRRHGIAAVLIAMPSAPSRVIRNVVSLAREGGAREVRIIPGLDRLLNGQARFSDLREVQLADLLGREPAS